MVSGPGCSFLAPAWPPPCPSPEQGSLKSNSEPCLCTCCAALPAEGWLALVSGSAGVHHTALASVDLGYHLPLILHFSFSLSLFFFFFFFLSFVCLRLHQQHMEVPRLGVQSGLKPPACTTATATLDLSRICGLQHSSQRCPILNPLSEAKDRTRVLTDTSRVH